MSNAKLGAESLQFCYHPIREAFTKTGPALWILYKARRRHTLTPSQEKCVPACQRAPLKSFPCHYGIPKICQGKQTQREKQVNVLLLFTSQQNYLLLVSKESILELVLRFLAKWKILEQILVITFSFFKLVYLNDDMRKTNLFSPQS